MVHLPLKLGACSEGPSGAVRDSADGASDLNTTVALHSEWLPGYHAASLRAQAETPSMFSNFSPVVLKDLSKT